MNIQYSDEFIHNLKKLSVRNNSFRRQVVRKINLFIADRNHPSLRLHKLKGEFKNVWSISVNRSIRILVLIDGGETIFVDIGTHDEVYKK